MQFAHVALAHGLASVALAADNRLLVKFTQPASQFPSVWTSACKNYKPTDSNLKYQEAYVNLGDFHGQHANNEAKVFCSFAYPRSPNSPTLFTKQVAAKVGATII
ncbi:hypothetical protein OC846_000707 [Tilletia horrida]|uniref:Uncharacterized protein n=1 Tax=Tilletia horrida TaxID=155126 RepID=A0AAN6GUK9_9BASI|nr:hypothetical protein OC846_000707 [Tilletia horrida]